MGWEPRAGRAQRGGTCLLSSGLEKLPWPRNQLNEAGLQNREVPGIPENRRAAASTPLKLHQVHCASHPGRHSLPLCPGVPSPTGTLALESEGLPSGMAFSVAGGRTLAVHPQNSRQPHHRPAACHGWSSGRLCRVGLGTHCARAVGTPSSSGHKSRTRTRTPRPTPPLLWARRAVQFAMLCE